MSKPDEIATNFPDGNLQIVACAGAGKTETVSRRVVAQLALPEIRPENVIAFTFTERAAAELKERIAQRFEDVHGTREGLADLYVGTIHGFCLEMLQQHQLELLSYRVLDDVQQRLFISRNSKASGLADLGWQRYQNAGTYAETMAILREADVDREALARSNVAWCLEKYEALLASKRYLDFTGILATTVALLEEPGETPFKQRVAQRVRHVTVDEYQDVNPVQERLVRALAALGAEVCVVGDDDQLLYAWRGSEVENILEFAQRYDDVQTVTLDRNFRSSRGVVDLGRGIAERLDGERLPKSMVAAGSQAYEDGDVTMRAFGHGDEEAAWIAQRIDELIGTPFRDRPDAEPRGLSYSDFAVLIRSRRHLTGRISDALGARGIPFVVGGITNLFETAEVRACSTLFAYLAGEDTLESVRQAWVGASLGVDPTALDRALAAAAENRALIEKGEGRFGIYNLQRSYLDFLTALELREEQISGSSPSNAHARAEVVFYNLGKFSQVISDFEQINFLSDPQRKYESFHGYLTYQAPTIYPEGWLETRYVTPNAVQILSIHQAKGLQWPVVFVPGLVKGVFPPGGHGGRSPWHAIPDGVVRNKASYLGCDDDERRLLYVACTRAKKFLHISHGEYPTGKRSWKNPSFLWHEAREVLASIDPPDPAPTIEKIEPRAAQETAEVRLSFSELKVGFACPYAFKLRLLYGFNPPIAEALGFGKSLHDALFELHDRALRGEDTSVTCVDELVDRHLYLPFAYAELRETLDRSARKRVRDYIEARAHTFPHIRHAERPIEVDLGDGIHVAGRVDLIIHDDGKVAIVDFKSSERVQEEDVSGLQLRTYAIGYQQASGTDADAIVIENLDDLSRPHREPVHAAQLENTKTAIRGFAERLRRNDLPRKPRPTKTGAKHPCDTCDVHGLCGGVAESPNGG